LVKLHDHETSEPVVNSANLVVNISAKPYGPTTWVFLNGATELGSTPLRVRFPHSGRYRLLFSTPELGWHARMYKTIVVTGRSRQWVSASMGPSREVARF
jgi:hypothetical protein